MQDIEIIHKPTETEPFVVLNKPAGIPSAPLTENETGSVFVYAANIYPELLSVSGRKKIEHGLMHRLDTQTNGLILIAASQYFYDFMQKEQQEGRFEKVYAAECDIVLQNIKQLSGFPRPPVLSVEDIEKENPFLVSSYFRNFGSGQKEVRPVLETSGKAALKKCRLEKEYTTEIKITADDGIHVSAECRIRAGYRHQVRCHLAWLGIPVEGDNIYNSISKQDMSISGLKFKATEIFFTNPMTNERMHFKCADKKRL